MIIPRACDAAAGWCGIGQAYHHHWKPGGPRAVRGHQKQRPPLLTHSGQKREHGTQRRKSIEQPAQPGAVRERVDPQRRIVQHPQGEPQGDTDGSTRTQTSPLLLVRTVTIYDRAQSDAVSSRPPSPREKVGTVVEVTGDVKGVKRAQMLLGP